MTILKGSVIPHCESIPTEIEVAYQIVSRLVAKGILKVRKEMIGDITLFLWELKTESEN